MYFKVEGKILFRHITSSALTLWEDKETVSIGYCTVFPCCTMCVFMLIFIIFLCFVSLLIKIMSVKFKRHIASGKKESRLRTARKWVNIEQMLEVMCHYKFIKQVTLFMYQESKNLHWGMFKILQKENLALQLLLEQTNSLSILMLIVADLQRFCGLLWVSYVPFIWFYILWLFFKHNCCINQAISHFPVNFTPVHRVFMKQCQQTLFLDIGLISPKSFPLF